jgi:hypothetical protein
MKAFQSPCGTATDAFLLQVPSIFIVIGFSKKNQYKSAQHTLNLYSPAQTTIGLKRKRHNDFLPDYAAYALQCRYPVFRQLGLCARRQ